jgi:hypothetical protein
MRGAHQENEGNKRKEEEKPCVNWNCTKRQNKPLNEPAKPNWSKLSQRKERKSKASRETLK